VAAAFAVLSGLAVAQGTRFEQYVSFRMSVNHPTQGFVFDIRSARKDPYDTTPPFVSRASFRLSPTLCEGAYSLAFVFTTVRGRTVRYPYPVRIRRARLNGAPRRCPFASLPPRGLKSMRVRVTFTGNNILMRFNARPSTQAGLTFGRLKASELRVYRFTAPGGLVRVQISTRYASARPRLSFVADTKAPR